MTVLFGPADAIAASRCLIARSITDGKTADHPRRCGWCEEPVADLRLLVAGFNDWAAYRPTGKTGGTSERHEIRIWMELDRDEQRRQIALAQAFVDEPVEVVVAAPAVARAPAGTVSPPEIPAGASATEAPGALQPPTSGPADVAVEEGPAWLA